MHTIWTICVPLSWVCIFDCPFATTPPHLHLVLDRVAAVLRQAVNHFQSGSLCNSLLEGKKNFARLCWDRLGCKPRAMIAGRMLASLGFQSCKARTQRRCSLTSCWWERLPHSALYANFRLRAEISFGSWSWIGPRSERLGTCDWWNRSRSCRLWVYRIQYRFGSYLFKIWSFPLGTHGLKKVF